MQCKICGRELIAYDWLIIDGVSKGPVCHGGYDCYPMAKVKPISPKMVKVHKIAARYAS